MSYRTFKRVLGETNLERKCRWWFGISLFVMLSLSFTWYGRQTDKLVENNIKALSQEYVRAGWQRLHIEKLATIEGPGPRTSDRRISIASWPRAACELSRGFEWEPILPPRPDGTELDPKESRRATNSSANCWPSGRCDRRSRRKHCRKEQRESEQPELLPHDANTDRNRRQPGLPVLISRCTRQGRASLVTRHLAAVAEPEPAGRRLDGGGPRDDRRPGRRSTPGRRIGPWRGRRRSSSGSCRCFRCGPWCGM